MTLQICFHLKPTLKIGLVYHKNTNHQGGHMPQNPHGFAAPGTPCQLPNRHGLHLNHKWPGFGLSKNGKRPVIGQIFKSKKKY